MTKRAQAIDKFIETLGDMAYNATAIKTSIMGVASAPGALSKKDAQEWWDAKNRNLKAFMVDIVEENEEQAEALMKDLNVKWKRDPYKK